MFIRCSVALLRRRIIMKVRSLLFLFVVTTVSLFSGLVTLPVTARVAIPDRLEILRTIGRSSHNPAHEMVTQVRLVQDLYHDMILLPVAPADQVCPQYIMANYQLTFFSHNVVVQKANALRGMCQPVTLGNNDIRVATTKFWGLMNKAFVAGKPISTPASSTPTPTLTRTPISTLGGGNVPSPTGD
jgi:hypothetical protein